MQNKQACERDCERDFLPHGFREKERLLAVYPASYLKANLEVRYLIKVTESLIVRYKFGDTLLVCSATPFKIDKNQTVK